MTLVEYLGDRVGQIPSLQSLLETVMARGRGIQELQIDHVFPRVGHLVMRLNARCNQAPPDSEPLLVLTLSNIADGPASP